MWLNVYWKKKSHTNHVKMDPVYWWKWRRVDHTVVEPSVLERDVPNDDVPILVHVSVCADSGVVCYLKVPTGQYRPPGVHPRHLPYRLYRVHLVKRWSFSYTHTFFKNLQLHFYAIGNYGKKIMEKMLFF